MPNLIPTSIIINSISFSSDLGGQFHIDSMDISAQTKEGSPVNYTDMDEISKRDLAARVKAAVERSVRFYASEQ